MEIQRFMEQPNYVILGGQHSWKHLVELIAEHLTTFHQRYFKEKNMIFLSMFGALECLLLKCSQERFPIKEIDQLSSSIK